MSLYFLGIVPPKRELNQYLEVTLSLVHGFPFRDFSSSAHAASWPRCLPLGRKAVGATDDELEIVSRSPYVGDMNIIIFYVCIILFIWSQQSALPFRTLIFLFLRLKCLFRKHYFVSGLTALLNYILFSHIETLPKNAHGMRRVISSLKRKPAVTSIYHIL